MYTEEKHLSNQCWKGVRQEEVAKRDKVEEDIQGRLLNLEE